MSKITTYPKLIVVCGLKDLEQELDWLILSTPDDAILMSYDTTLQLRDFTFHNFLFTHV